MTIYQRIADSLRQQLISGQWQPGQRLPTEREMCRQFAASQITVRRALQILEQEHLVERRQGSGTFANSLAQRKIPILNADFFGSIRRHAPRLQRRLHGWQWAEMDAESAATLRGCVGDAVLKATRIDDLHGRPTMLDRVAIAGRYADRLGADDLAELDFLIRWQGVQKIRLEYCKQTIDAVRATAPISRLLQVRAGEPLLRETSLLFLAGEQPAGLFVSYYRHDTFCFEVSFSLAGHADGKSEPSRSVKVVARRPHRAKTTVCNDGNGWK